MVLHLLTAPRSAPPLIQERPGIVAGSPWRTLYRVAAGAALLVAAVIPIQTVIYLLSPPPDTVIEWFNLYDRNPLHALVDMDLLYMVDNAFAALVIIALAVVLFRASPSLTAIGATFGLLGIAVFFASNPAFAMLSLSRDYASAATAAERTMYLAAGEATMATWQGSSYLVSYELGAIATVILSLVMLRSSVFSRITAYIGIATGVLMLWPPVNTAGIVVSLLSLLPLLIWYVLIARRFLATSTGSPQTEWN
ncbi:MAG TPA: hypothetical protein VFL82_00165 [Thermomicrobiales bacterium]|nr:hypothetical protein [Thermomicrobiales bacterium]